MSYPVRRQKIQLRVRESHHVRKKLTKCYPCYRAASSDHAWGFWNRAHSNGEGLADIRYIFSCYVTNDVALALIDKALKDKKPDPGQTEETKPKDIGKWPGVDFMSPYEDGATAVIGM